MSRAPAGTRAGYAREELELPLSKVELYLNWSVHSSVDDWAGRAAPGSVFRCLFLIAVRAEAAGALKGGS